MRSHRNRDADACVDGYDIFPRTQAPPHLSATAEKEPNFFDGAVSDGLRRLAGSELEMRETAAV